jgi:hypothetical protein
LLAANALVARSNADPSTKPLKVFAKFMTVDSFFFPEKPSGSGFWAAGYTAFSGLAFA